MQYSKIWGVNMLHFFHIAQATFCQFYKKWNGITHPRLKRPVVQSGWRQSAGKAAIGNLPSQDPSGFGQPGFKKKTGQ